MSETDIQYEGVINNLRQQYNLSVENQVLDEVIGGLDSGMKWVLRKYKRVDFPRIMIGEHSGSLNDVNGFTETEAGEKLICLQIDELRKLNGVDLSAKITEDYGDDIPVKPELTIRQYYESFGVEETLHWLQDIGVEELAKLPPQKERIQPDSPDYGLRYMLQPHELQGLSLRGEYFMEKYGTNPLQELEDFIKSKQT